MQYYNYFCEGQALKWWRTWYDGLTMKMKDTMMQMYQCMNHIDATQGGGVSPPPTLRKLCPLPPSESDDLSRQHKALGCCIICHGDIAFVSSTPTHMQNNRELKGSAMELLCQEKAHCKAQEQKSSSKFECLNIFKHIPFGRLDFFEGLTNLFGFRVHIFIRDFRDTCLTQRYGFSIL